MSARQLLEQLLQAGQGLARNASRPAGGSSPARGGQSGGLPPFLSGALGAGVLSAMLGGKGMSKFGGKAARYGGMAALGVLAYRAYQQWQQQQAAASPASAATASWPEPRTLDRLPEADVEQHSRAVLVAMIGAAKADGHIGEAERQLIEGELARIGDAQDRAWFQAELARPLDPAQVAQAAQTPEMAAEMYLASLLVVDDEGFMERAYLDELARRMGLAPQLKANLEAQARGLQQA